MCWKRYHSIFPTISLKFKCKISVHKEVIHSFKKSLFGHVISYELTHFNKMVRVSKTKSLLFCLRYDPLIVFLKVKSYNFHFHKNDVTWPLSANGLLQTKATKQRIVLKHFGGVPVLKFFQRFAFEFSICLSVIFPGLSNRQMYRKFKKWF